MNTNMFIQKCHKKRHTLLTLQFIGPLSTEYAFAIVSMYKSYINVSTATHGDFEACSLRS